MPMGLTHTIVLVDKLNVLTNDEGSIILKVEQGR